MPYRNYRRKAPAYRAKRKVAYRAKKAYRKRANAPSKLVYRPKKALGSIVPDRYFTKLRYNQLQTVTLATGTKDFQYSLNSIFDCGGTADTTNVQGFSELTGLYNNWRVHMSKIVLHYATVSTVPQVVTLFPVVDDSKVPNSQAGLMDLPYSKTKMVSGASGTPKTVISGNMSVKRLLGLKTISNEEDVVGTSSAAPTRNLKWYLRIRDPANGNDNGTLLVNIVYYVEFFNRTAALNQS